MKPNRVVSREKWLTERIRFLNKEKKLTRQLDELTRDRQQLPWVKSDLFKGKNQLLIYHFMFGPDWKEGCPSCSFWADNFQGIQIHLAHRDVSMVAISRAPLEKINTYKKRMGWDFKWVSSFNSNFNFEFQVSFKQADGKKKKVFYNFGNTTFFSDEAPGITLDHGLAQTS